MAGRTQKSLALLCVLGSVLVTGAARSSAERVTVLVYPGAKQAEALTEVSATMSAILEAEDLEEIDVFTEALAALEAGARPAEELRAFTLARETMEEGWRSYLEVRASFASARLAAARTAALELAGLSDGQELLAEISLRLGVSKLALGRKAEAADDFRLAHALAPERAVSDVEFRPDVVSAYDTALAESRVQQARPLRLSPDSASLWIDGVARSGESVELADGLHLVVAKASGFQSQSKLISVSPGADAPIVMDLAEDPVAQAILRGRAALATGVAETEARLAASAVILYGASDSLVLMASVWRREQPALLGQICKGQPATCSPVIEVGYPEGGLRVAADQLWRDLSAATLRFPPTLQVDARLIAGESAPGQGRKTAPTPLWKNRWLWLGVAGASLAAGAYLLLDGDSEIKPIFTGDRCDFGGC